MESWGPSHIFPDYASLHPGYNTALDRVQNRGRGPLLRVLLLALMGF